MMVNCVMIDVMGSRNLKSSLILANFSWYSQNGHGWSVYYTFT